MKKFLALLFIMGMLLVSMGMYRHFHAPDGVNRKPHRIAGSGIGIYQTGEPLRSGDLIFQTSLSSQSQAIQLATHSKYSHCGILFKEDDQIYVLEAIQPVKKTSLPDWIKRGKDQHYVVKRLKNSKQILSDTVIDHMRKIGQDFEGKDYDLAFEWTDEKIYCSELIWKIYERATGIRIGEPGQLKDFDLSSGVVRNKLQERYGDEIPLGDTVVSPAAIFNSPLLETVR